MQVTKPRLVILVWLTVLIAGVSSPAVADLEDGSRGSATLDGQPINLTAGWGDAVACLYWPDATDHIECFRSEAAMDRRIAELEGLMGLAVGHLAEPGVEASTCSGYLRLYDGTG